MRSNVQFIALSIGLTFGINANAALTLHSPLEGIFLKNPTEITYQAKGLQFSTAASITLSAPNYAQTAWWYKYNGGLLRQVLTTPPPNNTWVTATLRDGPATSSRRYRTAFPWTIPSSIGVAAASSQYASFPKGYCTNFASRAFHAGPSINVSYIPWSGNAKDWIVNADRAGWRTTSSTTEGAIGAVAVWRGGGFGHVGVVVDMNRTAVAGEIEYTINEMNWGALIDPVNAITKNFGKVSSLKLKSSSMGRSAAYPFVGFVLPQRK